MSFITNKIDIFKETFVAKKLRTYIHKRNLMKKEQLLDAIKLYACENITNEEKDKLLKDILSAVKKYSISSKEYFLFEFPNHTEEERRQFVPSVERVDVCEMFNKSSNRSFFENKFETYKLFRKYYKREVVSISGNNEKSITDFSEFIKKHPQFIVKPKDSSGGHGIKIYDSLKFENASVLFNNLISDQPLGFIMEELVKQCTEMAEFHPSSVNTVRITTVRLDTRTVIMHPFAKFGQNGRDVDNGGSGGILATINVDSGMIMNAADELGNRYEKHPYSEKQIIGFQIPRWEEAKLLAKELAEVIPTNRYTGWDLALTEDGWVMIEGNEHGGFIGWQMVDRKGFRDEIYGYIKELK